MEPRREQFDSMENNFFVKRINGLNKAQKDINLEKHMTKFLDNQKQLEERAKILLDEEIQNDVKVKEEMRKINLNKLQRNMTFMEDWQKKGIENWTKNIETKNTRELRDSEFMKKKNKIKLEKLQNEYDLENDDVFNGISIFEKNLHKFGIETEPAFDEEKKREKCNFF